MYGIPAQASGMPEIQKLSGCRAEVIRKTTPLGAREYSCILWAATTETGADVMKRIAAPMIGGVITSLILELTVYPAIFAVWKGRNLLRQR